VSFSSDDFVTVESNLCVQPREGGKQQIRRLVRNQGGFTLLDVMFVCALISVLFMMAVPLLTRSKGSAQSASAIGTLRFLNSAQLDFAISCGYGFYAADLTTLGIPPIGSPHAFVGPEMSSAVTVMRAGYNFTVAGSVVGAPPPCNGAGPVSAAYVAIADPVDVVLAPRWFATNADGLVYEHTASLGGIMPESGSPNAGVPIQ
jgi:hypothetical protein